MPRLGCFIALIRPKGGSKVPRCQEQHLRVSVAAFVFQINPHICGELSRFGAGNVQSFAHQVSIAFSGVKNSSRRMAAASFSRRQRLRIKGSVALFGKLLGPLADCDAFTRTGQCTLPAHGCFSAMRFATGRVCASRLDEMERGGWASRVISPNACSYWPTSGQDI